MAEIDEEEEPRSGDAMIRPCNDHVLETLRQADRQTLRVTETKRDSAMTDRPTETGIMIRISTILLSS